MTLQEAWNKAAAKKDEPSGLSVGQLLERASLPDTIYHRLAIRRFIKAEIAAGRAIASWGARPSIDGYMRTVPVYKAIAAKTAKKKAAKKS